MIDTPNDASLNGKDAMLIVELTEKVVEHANILSGAQCLISENLEELVESQSRIEEKIDVTNSVIKDIDPASLIKIINEKNLTKETIIECIMVLKAISDSGIIKFIGWIKKALIIILCGIISLIGIQLFKILIFDVLPTILRHKVN